MAPNSNTLVADPYTILVSCSFIEQVVCTLQTHETQQSDGLDIRWEMQGSASLPLQISYLPSQKLIHFLHHFNPYMLPCYACRIYWHQTGKVPLILSKLMPKEGTHFPLFLLLGKINMYKVLSLMWQKLCGVMIRLQY